MTMDFMLPAPPATWDASKSQKIHAKLAPFESRAIEPAGASYIARIRRFRLKRTIAEDFAMREALREADLAGAETDDDEIPSAKLLKSDPANWRDLGIFN
jgi:DnaJ homolog subfamily C member 2